MSGPNYVNSRRVIPREEFGVLDEAAQYNEESRKVYHNLQNQADQARASASDEGYREGFELGRREAFEELVKAIEESKKKLFVLEDMLTPIVMEAVEKIIGSMDDRIIVRRILREALAEAGHTLNVTLRVAPEDLDDLRDMLDEIQHQGEMKSIDTIRPDAILKEGEMILETPQGRIHIGLKHQMDRLRAGIDPNAGGH